MKRTFILDPDLLTPEQMEAARKIVRENPESLSAIDRIEKLIAPYVPRGHARTAAHFVHYDIKFHQS